MSALPINTGSEPDSWARHWMLTDQSRTERLFWAGLPGAFFTPPAPTCAHRRAVLCGCADHIWKG